MQFTYLALMIGGLLPWIAGLVAVWPLHSDIQEQGKRIL